MEHGGRRSRAVVEPCMTHIPRLRISNRQWLGRLENAATCRKQTSEVNSNRHNREGFSAAAGGNTEAKSGEVPPRVTLGREDSVNRNSQRDARRDLSCM
jgi:hypothetical protein